MRVRVLREEGAQAAERCRASEKAATSSRKALSHLSTQEEEVAKGCSCPITCQSFNIRDWSLSSTG